MKTVLIPTDFRLKALEAIPNICHQFPDEKIEFVFVHLFKLSDSITDLLMLARRNREYEHISDEFYKELVTIQNSSVQVSAIRIEFFYGSTLSMFRNFLEHHEITHVLDPAHCTTGKLNKSSIDPSSLMQRSALPFIGLVAIPAKVAEVEVERNELAEAM